MTNRVPREMKIFGLGVLAAGVLAILITVIIVSVGRSGTPSNQNTASAQPAGQTSLDLSSFQFPRQFTESWVPRWYASRDQQKRWTWEEVQKYWVDPRTSVIESLSGENDKKIATMLNGAQ